MNAKKPQLLPILTTAPPTQNITNLSHKWEIALMKGYQMKAPDVQNTSLSREERKKKVKIC